MGQTMHRGIAVRVLITFVFASVANAASINYGNFGPVPPGVSFLGVTESSITDAVPLYGPPTPFAIGLDFNPISFGSASTGGPADITEGQLNFTTTTLFGVGKIKVNEAGDYTLTGAGGPATAVSAGAIIRATITQVNGLNIAPISLLPSNVIFNDAEPPPQTVSPWSISTTLDVAAQMLLNGFSNLDLATRVDVVINNTLTSSSEANTASSIAKKDFTVTVDYVNVLPEPGALALLGAGLGTLAMRRRRSSKSA